jgi:thermostable 8-oxoguanine DNA glycosylase
MKLNEWELRTAALGMDELIKHMRKVQHNSPQRRAEYIATIYEMKQLSKKLTEEQEKLQAIREAK